MCLAVFGPKRPPQEVYTAVWARFIRRASAYSRWIRFREATVVRVVRLLGKPDCWSALGNVVKSCLGLIAGSSFQDSSIG